MPGERWWVPAFILAVILAEALGIVWLYHNYSVLREENEDYQAALWRVAVDNMRRLMDSVEGVVYQYNQSRSTGYTCSLDIAMLMFDSGSKHASMGASALKGLGRMTGSVAEDLAGERYKLYLLSVALETIDIYMHKMEQEMIKANSTRDMQVLAEYVPLLREISEDLREIVFTYREGPEDLPLSLVRHLLETAEALVDLAYGRGSP